MMTDFIFWLAVILLVLVIQNIVLAIIARAYGEACDVEGRVEFVVLYTLWLRIIWVLK